MLDEMSEIGRKWLTTLVVIAFALGVFVPTINWGLPTRDSDRLLFGDRKPWTGKEILALLEGPDSSLIPHSSSLRGADVDSSPIFDRSKPVLLNDTDAKRAEIVQRYRLMSKQPDEFIQFKALAEMSARSGISKLDPRLYQYGGLWIYPVGALVRGAMMVGYIQQPPTGVPAKEFYLDHPDIFGKFYVVARAYSMLWGIVAALAIVWITRRLTDSNTLAALAAIAFILLPVTRTAAHEAKPHLAGAALCLCAVISATHYVESGKRRYALLAGTLCGAAMAMVVSMLMSLAVLPVMALLRWRHFRNTRDQNALPRTRGRGQGEGESAGRVEATNEPQSDRPLTRTLSRLGSAYRIPDYRGERISPVTALFLSSAAAFFVYAFTNPFLIYNAVFHPAILKSNLGNSTAMYGVGNLGEALLSAIRIAVAGMTLGGMILAALSMLVLVIARFVRRGDACVDRERQDDSSQPAGEASLAPTGVHQRSETMENWVPRSCNHGRASAASPARPKVPDRGTHTVAYLLAAPAICVLIQFVLLAAGKPAEYARFGLVLFAAASLAFSLAWGCVSLLKSPRFIVPVYGLIAMVITQACILNAIIPYLEHDGDRPIPPLSLIKRGDVPSRYGKTFWTLGLSHEPAPWSVMPLNLFRDQLILTQPAPDPKTAIYDVYLFPSNLSSQIGMGNGGESVDWADNRTQMRLGSLPPTAGPSSTRSR